MYSTVVKNHKITERTVSERMVSTLVVLLPQKMSASENPAGVFCILYFNLKLDCTKCNALTFNLITMYL